MKKILSIAISFCLIVLSGVVFVACNMNKVVGFEFVNYQQEYLLNEVFKYDNTILMLELRDESFESVYLKENMIKKMPDMSTIGRKTVEVEYKGEEYSYTIDVLSEGLNTIKTSLSYLSLNEGDSLFKVLSSSMSPYFEANDMVVIKEAVTYNVGDVIMFSIHNGLYVTHRIIAIKTDPATEKVYYITHGDAVQNTDGGYDHIGDYNWEIYRLQDMTYGEVLSNCANIQFVKFSDIVGKVINVIDDLNTIKLLQFVDSSIGYKNFLNIVFNKNYDKVALIQEICSKFPGLTSQDYEVKLTTKNLDLLNTIATTSNLSGEYIEFASYVDYSICNSCDINTMLFLVSNL